MSIILILILTLFASTACSQSVDFQFSVYFEDAMGNTNTITLGYGKNLELGQYYPELGEDSFPCNLQFERDLEVWVDKTYWNGTNCFLLKSAFLRLVSYEDQCASEIPFLAVKCKNPPLKVSWDQQWNCDPAGDATCHWGSYFFNTFAYFLIERPEDFDLITYHPLCFSTSFEEPFGSIRPANHNFPYHVYRFQENPDESIDTIYTLFFEFGQNTLDVLSANNHKFSDLSYKLFPNPGAENGFYFEGENMMKGLVKVINQVGQIVHFQVLDGSHHRVLIHTPKNIPHGLYTVIFSSESGQIFSLKWTKQ